MPPSLPRKTRFGVAGLPSSVDRSQSMPCWSACGPLWLAQVWPPLVDARSAHVGVEDVVLVVRVDPDAAEPPLEAAVGVRAARRERALGGAAGRAPRVAAVVGVVEALVRAVRAAEDDVDAVRVARRDGDADAAEARVLRQAGLRLVVGSAASGRRPSSPGASRSCRRRRSGTGRSRCRRRCGCRWCAGGPTARAYTICGFFGLMTTSIAPVDRVRGRQDELPRLARVARAVQAALAGRAGDVSRSRDEHACSSSSGRPRCGRSTRSGAGPRWSSWRRCRSTCRRRRRSR